MDRAYSEPSSSSAPVPGEVFFVGVVLEEATFRVFVFWKASKDNPLKALPLHDSGETTKRSGGLSKMLASLAKESGLIDLQKFLGGRHEKGNRQGRVYLPYNMYGEYGPAVTALLCGTSVTVTYAADAKRGAAETVVALLRCVGDYGLVGLDKQPADLYGKFSDLHYDWKDRDVPGAFRAKVAALATEAKLGFFRALYQEVLARSAPRQRGKKVSASLAEGNSVSAAPPLRCCIWMRQALNNPSKNMTPDLLGVIVEELARVLVVYARREGIEGTPCEVVLLGDAAGVSAPDCLELLNQQLAAHRYPEVGVVADLRGFFDTQGPFAKLHSSLPPSADDEVHGVGGFISYLDQWLVLYFLQQEKHVRFVVGTESGNMDVMGYTGTPVISIDLTDPTAGTPTSILTDRIGQYALLSPLWQVVNWQGGEDRDLFREYLRGAMLRYVYAAHGDDVRAPEKQLPPQGSGRGRGTLVLDERNDPVAVRYASRSFTVEQVNDVGNCFYECCAIHAGRGADTYMQDRALLSASAHLGAAERDRVGRDGEYATTEDIQAMANELGITIVLHECQYGTAETQPRQLVGGAGGTMHLLFQFLPNGEGHIQPMRLNAS